MKMNVWDRLKYPVTLEIMNAIGIFTDPDGTEESHGEWNTVFIAENVADLEFRLSAYHRPSYFQRMRLVEADETTHEQSHADVADFNEVFNETAQRELEPLRAFIKAAPERATERIGKLFAKLRANEADC